MIANWLDILVLAIAVLGLIITFGGDCLCCCVCSMCADGVCDVVVSMEHSGGTIELPFYTSDILTPQSLDNITALVATGINSPSCTDLSDTGTYPYCAFYGPLSGGFDFYAGAIFYFKGGVWIERRLFVNYTGGAYQAGYVKDIATASATINCATYEVVDTLDRCIDDTGGNATEELTTRVMVA